ncbi:MAG: hypothetical protein Kow0099_26270 [Candidatus Abyssubacteria bacterium]
MKGFWWGVLAGVIFCSVLGGLIGFSLLGRKATVEPPDWEAYLAAKLKQLNIPEADPQTEPVELTDDYLLEGGEHYNHHCAVCHDLEGDADSDLAKAFYPPVSDLTDERVQKYSDRQLKWIVQYGIRYTGMPGWEKLITEEDQWNVTHYVRVFGDPERASRLEQMLKERGLWEVGLPVEHHEESVEHKHGTPADHSHDGQARSPEEHP